MNSLLTVNELRLGVRAASPGCTMLGIDFGVRKIGMALSDRGDVNGPIIASPYQTYIRESLKVDANYLRLVAQKHKVRYIVVGLPLTIDSCMEVGLLHGINKMIDAMQKITYPMPLIYMQDERFSTSRSINLLRDMGCDQQKTSMWKDSIAASYILQDAIDLVREGPAP